jgi:hypothetical protein
VVDIRDEERRALSERSCGGTAADCTARWRGQWKDAKGSGGVRGGCNVVRRVWVIEGGTWPMTIEVWGEAVGVGATSFLERPHTASQTKKKLLTLSHFNCRSTV